MKTITDVRNSFWDYLNEVSPNMAKERRSKKRQNDYNTDIRCTFVDYVDNLRRDNQISEKLAQRVTL